MPQPSSTRQVSSTGLSRRCCLRASPDRPTRLRLAVPKWTRRQGEETPLGPSSGEETPISQDGMSYRVRSLPSSLFHPSNRALPSDCVARVENLVPGSSCDCSSLFVSCGELELWNPGFTDLSHSRGSSVGVLKGLASSLTCALQVALRGELLPLVVPPQLERQP